MPPDSAGSTDQDRAPGSAATWTASLMFKRLDDGSWFAESLTTPGCWGEGSTRDEAAADYESALREWAAP